MSTGRAKEKVRIHIRWMIRRDMAEVLAAELASFEYAWTEDDFLRCLRQRNCIGMVAETDDRVIGFMMRPVRESRITFCPSRYGLGFAFPVITKPWIVRISFSVSGAWMRPRSSTNCKAEK